MITRIIFIFSLLPLFYLSRAEAGPNIFNTDYVWKNADGKSIVLKDFRGKKVVFAMVYTSCQSACPLITKKMKKIEAMLKAEKTVAEFVVISFDSEHDNSDRLKHFQTHNDLTGSARLVFKVSSANILGLRNIMLTNTRGTAVISTYFLGYEPKGSKLESLRNGALVATQTGTAASYGLVGAQERGSLFISPGDPVYEGMVVGVASKPMDIEVNAIKEKQLTNNRSSGEGVKESLTSASKLSLEQSLDFIEDDELLEVTPISLRIRKRFLTEADRRVAKRSALK
jgi:predicted membrane GTPase involved in stress response